LNGMWVEELFIGFPHAVPMRDPKVYRSAGDSLDR
jgi:hypothetical protein